MKYGHAYHETDLADTAKPVTSRIRVELVFLSVDGGTCQVTPLAR
jgi:hypothetical protein